MAARFAGVVAVIGPLLIAGAAWAPPAQADATSYLNHLHSAGIRDYDRGDDGLLQVGQKLCNQITYGASPAELVGLALQHSDATLGPNGLTPEQANALVGYAIVDLCPGA
ncbi:hypothetical protein BST11_12840 [Mycobacterium alsense]|uniref:DUF732 domain-containing protein n=1 Tax=Mycobacterium alsense TaxID=324058 RepID=A0AA42BZ99_9MYCO|nr:DUF732 domain-containing protein [Mycobacterium alsense]MCV7379673.1 DUF732 domain-containing protein [Mycobacterium alsense]OQZ90443.1 hypothetical protein BST11_12840 [Mycobacterium alsense]